MITKGTSDLVIFDCDGVLVDSEVIGCRVEADFLANIGIPISADEIMERYVGLSETAMFADLEARYHRKLPLGFAENLRERIATAFDAELASMPGIEVALNSISSARCVASSSKPERLRKSLTLARLLQYFEPHIFSAVQVTHGKPAPDLFLFAASQMKARAETCTVIEDSEAGVKGAIAAGMRVIGFTGGSHCKPGHSARLREAGATAICDDMRNLPALL
jgi:HAD superfamily hydrolase (TIGR01509 family)